VTKLATGEPADPSWRVTLHFHPDRLAAGTPILERMARDGVYRSQFETGTSNGGLTAYPDGDRWRWESRIFAGAYDDGPPAARPKYGSLNFRRRLAGGSPRFGSAYLRLAAPTLSRTTFCYPDSALEPRHFGVAPRLSTLIALAEADEVDPLDDYIEAQNSWPSVSLSPATAFSIRESSETPLAPAGTTSSISNGSGITWPGSALRNTALTPHGSTGHSKHC
jgi:hypothetical protein